MPHIVSNSPTHSLPNVSYSALDASDTMPRADVASSDMPEVEITIPPSRLEQQTDAVLSSEESAAAHAIPVPVLQRAISTSPRLEHTTDGTQSAECRDSSDNELLFFPLTDISQDADQTVSLSSGCIRQNGCGETRNNVRASDTVLSMEASVRRGQVGSTSRERIRSGIRRVMRFASQPDGNNAEYRESGQRLRKDSATSSRSGTGNRYGSSIFGSKLFESTSTCSIGSQRINIVADSPSVEPVFSSHYSVSCDESSFPHGEPLSAENRQEPFLRKNTRFRTTSASSDLQSERFSAADNSESVSLHRTRSLPSRHATSSSDSQDEISDSVSELSPVASASTTKQRKWQMTMPELTEGPENDTLSSHGQKRENLAAAALAIIRGEYKGWGTDGEQTTDKQLVTTDDAMLPVVSIRLEKRRYIKNLLVMSAAYFFLFSAYFALRNLQSSLNAVDGLGLYALSSMYCALIFGSLFSTTVVQLLQPKRTLSLSLIGFISYSAANFYPRFYTMIPASIVHGFFMAVGYTAQSTYLTNISAGYAELVGKKTKDVLSQFHGTYFIFLQFSQIAGGLISSLLLSPTGSHTTELSYSSLYGNYSDNSSTALFCGSSYCPSASRHIEMNSNVDLRTLLILMGCFAASTITGCVILILFLDPLGGVMKKSATKLNQQMTAVFRFFLQRRARLVIGLSFYSLLEVTFMFGEFTKVSFGSGFIDISEFASTIRTSVFFDLSLPTLDTVVHNSRILFANQSLRSCNKIVQWFLTIRVY